MNRITFSLSLLMLFSIGCSSSETTQPESQRPNFSGRWIFSAEESSLQIATPDKMEFTIDQSDSHFQLSRSLTFGERTDHFEIELVIGADAIHITREDAVLYPSIQWSDDGKELIFLTKINKNGSESTNEVRYLLENEGTVLVADEQFRGPTLNYTNRWVFIKSKD